MPGDPEPTVNAHSTELLMISRLMTDLSLPSAYHGDCTSSSSIPILSLTAQRNFCLHPR
jgi:hypothetical protein